MPRKKTPPTKRPLPASTLDPVGPARKVAATAKVYDLVQGEGYVALAAQGKRSSMEDAFSCDIADDAGGVNLYGVYDGHGGNGCSGYCKRFLLSTIRAKLRSGVDKALVDSFQTTDRKYCELCEIEESRVDGSTAVVVAHDTFEDRLHVANVGDSRAIVVQNKVAGYAELSEVHLPSIPSEQKRIEALGGHIVQDKAGTLRVEGVLMVSRSIGDSYLKKFVSGEPTTRTFDVDPERDHCVVLASDGLFDYMEPEELSKVFRDAKNMDELKILCERVVGTTIGRGSEDNVTILVIPLRPSLKAPGDSRRNSSICCDDD
jgi:protein phosphatase 1L